MRALTIDTINRGTTLDFVAVLGAVFENSPWLVERAAGMRPFHSREELIRTLLEVMQQASADEKMALIAAHPDLAGKAARARELTHDSAREQTSAGLDSLTKREFETFHDLNRNYRIKFGFPFIIAVRDHTKHSILEAFHQRLCSDRQVEMAEAIRNIGRIVALRIIDRIAE